MIFEVMFSVALVIVLTVVTWVASLARKDLSFRWRNVMRAMVTVPFVLIGASHFVSPATFVSLVPESFPLRLVSIYLTGVLEWVLAVLLWTRWERPAGMWSAVYLVLVLPFNIYAQPSPNYLLQRVPLQLAFAAMAYFGTRRQLPGRA